MGWLLPIRLRMANRLLPHTPAGRHVPLCGSEQCFPRCTGLAAHACILLHRV